MRDGYYSGKYGTEKEVSFEWSHHRFLSKDLKVTTIITSMVFFLIKLELEVLVVEERVKSGYSCT